MKNYIGQGLIFSLLVTLMTIALSWVPSGWSVGGFALRPMDIFSDIRKNTSVPVDSIPVMENSPLPDTVLTDTTASAPLIQPLKDSSQYGRLIEDYTYDQSGLRRFFAAVDSIAHGRTVRVAWYGDSFVEGDILIGDLRDTLQSLWGGNGVGFVPITSHVAQFKRSLKHSFNGWGKPYSILEKSENRPRLGVNGYAHRGQAEAKIHYEGLDYFRHTRRWTRFRYFYTAEHPLTAVWQSRDGSPNEAILEARADRLQSFLWNRPEGTDAFAMRFPAPEGMTAYGATLEDGPGIYIDNFAVRGNSGGALRALDPDFMRQFDRFQQYDLIVLQVGLNAVTNALTNIKWYRAELDKTFEHLKHCFPGRPILIIGVADRGGKVGDDLKTMISVPYITQMQRELAQRHGLLFYDLFHGMGGPGTMIRFAENHPRWANLDYTHLTHEGGKILGHRLANLWVREKERFSGKKPDM